MPEAPHPIRRWEKQAPAQAPRDRVNYSGNVASGLRFESADGHPIAVDPQTVTHLFDTLRCYNPLWDGAATAEEGDTDRLQHWFGEHVAGHWNLDNVATEAARFHRVLRAEGLELPRIRAADAVRAAVGREVIFFDRRNLCLAKLLSVVHDASQADTAESPLRIDFEVIPLPEVDWKHDSPFAVGASENMVIVNRGYFDISMTSIWVVTAPALITDIRPILTREHKPAKRIRPIRELLMRWPPTEEPS
jgi:hypothetical protein